jgi:UDP-2-acetamido-2-deoxy-ribo-hexuluronate aminotransferase
MKGLANMDIKFVDLKAQYLAYKEEIDRAIQGVIDSTQFISGPQIRELEAGLAAFTGAGYCIACSSGTDALMLSLMALGVKAGDEVITTPFSFVATAETIALLGARPVFADIDEETYTIDTTRLEASITEQTKAVVPVSLYGQPSDMDEINALASRHGIPVIEDAAQSFGAEYKGRKSCNLSTMGCTSFFPAKPLGCYGDGGAIFTSDEEIAAHLRALLNHGQTERYVHKHIGMNGRLDTIQAAILQAKLKYFPQEIIARQAIAQRYTTAFASQSGIVVPRIRGDRTSVYAQYSIRIENRDKAIKELSSHGIPTAIHYPIPMHLQEAFRYLGYRPGDFPVAEKVSKGIMSLPMSAFLAEEQQDYVIDRLADISVQGERI